VLCLYFFPPPKKGGVQSLPLSIDTNLHLFKSAISRNTVSDASMQIQFLSVYFSSLKFPSFFGSNYKFDALFLSELNVKLRGLILEPFSFKLECR